MAQQLAAVEETHTQLKETHSGLQATHDSLTTAHHTLQQEAVQEKKDLTEHIASLEAGGSKALQELSHELSASEEEKARLEHLLNEAHTAGGLKDDELTALQASRAVLD